jgi:hypothetical protein
MNCPKCNETLIYSGIYIKPDQLIPPVINRQYLIVEVMLCQKCNAKTTVETLIQTLQSDTKDRFLDEMVRIIGSAEEGSKSVKVCTQCFLVPIPKDGETPSGVE